MHVSLYVIVGRIDAIEVMYAYDYVLLFTYIYTDI